MHVPHGSMYEQKPRHQAYGRNNKGNSVSDMAPNFFDSKRMGVKIQNKLMQRSKVMDYQS